MAIVYLATNRINGKRYVGMTGRRLAVRRSQHEREARKATDSSPWFHAAIRKHGASNFDWMILSDCSDFDAALEEEKRLIREIRPEYNMSEGGRGNSGHTISPEHRAKISAARLGKPFSDEHRKNLSKAQTGKKHSAELIAKRMAPRLGKSLSDDHRAKIRSALKGRKRPLDVVERMLATRKKTFDARRMEAANGNV